MLGLVGGGVFVPRTSIAAHDGRGRGAGLVRAATAPTSASTTAGPSYYPGRGPRTMAFLVGKLARIGLSFRIRRVEAVTCKEAVVKSPPDARAHETPGPPVASWRIPCSRGVLILLRRRRRNPREPLRVTKKLQQLERHLAVAVDDAPRVAGNAPRAEVLDDGLDGAVRVHARTRQ